MNFCNILAFCSLTFFSACSASGSSSAIEFTVSGEALALGGYSFPSATGDEPIFVDGWEVRFEKLIAVFDHITLSENPDTSPGDQSKTGRLVAQVDGPWAADLHQGGPLEGKGGSDERAYPLTTLSNQNQNGNAPFDLTVRYAFGFRTVAATAGATLINITAADPDYAEMIQKGWTVLYVGTATWKGAAANPVCTTTNANYDFSKLPTTVHFRLGFATPSRYVNCQNPDNSPAAPLPGEEHQRGIQLRAAQTATAQLTFHSDHPFWQSFSHESPLHFDQLAALAVKDGAGNYQVTSELTAGVNFNAFKDQMGNALPWRSCTTTFTPPNSSQQMGFDSLSIPYNPTGDPATSLRDYRDYLSYSQSTQGHLNADGLCFIERDYLSPL